MYLNQKFCKLFDKNRVMLSNSDGFQIWELSSNESREALIARRSRTAKGSEISVGYISFRFHTILQGFSESVLSQRTSANSKMVYEGYSTAVHKTYKFALVKSYEPFIIASTIHSVSIWNMEHGKIINTENSKIFPRYYSSNS